MGMYRENSSVPSQLRTWGDSAARLLFRETKLRGGSTVSLETGKVPAKTDGFFVGSAPDASGQKIETVIIPEDGFKLDGEGGMKWWLARLYSDHLTPQQVRDSQTVHGGYIGTWVDAGLVYIDAVTWCETREEAVRLGLERGEFAIYDVAANGSLDLEVFRSRSMQAA
jgi:hypothetical protein